MAPEISMADAVVDAKQIKMNSTSLAVFMSPS